MTFLKRNLKLSTAVFAIFCVAETAGAADFNPEVAHNWSGSYLGVHLGGAINGDLNATAGGPAVTGQLNGFLGGFYVGYNTQLENIVLGLEGDMSFGEVDGAVANIQDFDIEPVGTFRARAGYAFGNMLPFATIGIGLADADQRIPGLGSPSNLHVGLVVGGGVEWAFSNALSARFEYQYHDYGTETYTYVPGNVRTNFDMHIIRAGLTWHIGSLF